MPFVNGLPLWIQTKAKFLAYKWTGQSRAELNVWIKNGNHLASKNAKCTCHKLVPVFEMDTFSFLACIPTHASCRDAQRLPKRISLVSTTSELPVLQSMQQTIRGRSRPADPAFFLQFSCITVSYFFSLLSHRLSQFSVYKWTITYFYSEVWSVLFCEQV